MFSYLQSIGRAVVDSVAPLMRTNTEQLSYIWTTIEAEYQRAIDRSETDDKFDLMTQTTLYDLFGTYVQLMISDETQGQNEDVVSPCIAAFIRDGMLDRICALGLSDMPAGIRCVITKSLDGLFSNLSPSLFTNMSSNNHLSLRQFIKVCFEKGDLEKRGNYRSSFISLLRTLSFRLRSDPTLMSIFFTTNAKNEIVFPLFSSLLTLLNAEHEDGIKAREAILSCLQLPLPHVSSYIMDQSLFSTQLLFGWTERYNRIVKGINDTEHWAEDLNMKKFIESFSHWQAYLNIILTTTDKTLISEVLLNNWLKECFYKLLEDSQSDQVSVVVSSNYCLQLVIDQIDYFHFRNKIPELYLNFRSEKFPDRTMLNHYYHQIESSESGNRLIETSVFRVIDSLISLRDPQILLLFCGKSFINGSMLESSQKKSFVELREVSLVRIGDVMQSFPAMKHLIKFENLEPYLIDAQTEGQLWFTSWESWLSEYKLIGAVDIDLIPIFREEKNLIEILFNRLSSFATNVFQTNLLVTGLLAKLCYCPHPQLHAFLLDPLLQVESNFATLFRILRHIYENGQSRVKGIERYNDEFELMKSRLTRSEVYESKSDVDKEIDCFIQSQIVFEEFLKELVAITQAKINIQSSLSKLQHHVEAVNLSRAVAQDTENN